MFGGGAEVGVDQFNQAIDVLDGDGFVFLLKVVHVTIEHFDEQFHRHCRVHARVGHAECALQAFEHAFAVAVRLRLAHAWSVSMKRREKDKHKRANKKTERERG